MKFLCVPCDKPMKLDEKKPLDRGSITLVYACEDCGYEMAMMTNPFETQVVGSLGVELAEGGSAEAGAGESRCPFTGMVRAAAGDGQAEAGNKEQPAGFPWSAEAKERLATIPQFVRPMAQSGIEKWAQDKGYSEVNGKVLDEAKDFFGM